MDYYQYNENLPTWELLEFIPEPCDCGYLVAESDLTPEQCERLRLACAGLAEWQE